MTRNIYIGFLAIVLVVGFFLFGYKKTNTPPLAEPAAQTASFGGVSLKIEYAMTPETREQGFGGRKNIPSNYGMLFVFPKDGRYGFWMKDMLMPLDIFWLNSKGQVVYIAQDVATSTYPNVFYPTELARYVLETAAGFAKVHTIATGTPLLLKSFPNVSQ